MSRKILSQDSMVQGVSQQPRSVRGFSFAERQENFVPHPILGLVRRNPTIFKGDLFDYAEFGQLKAHHYFRSEDEQYVFLFGQQQLKVFDLDGTEYPVEDVSANVPVSGQEGFGYLDFRKMTTNSEGAILYNNDILPQWSEALALTGANLTRTVTTDTGPLGYSKWLKFELITTGAGLMAYNPSSGSSVSDDDGTFSDATEYLSLYVKLDASGPDSVYLNWADSTGTTTNVILTYDWDGSALTLGTNTHPSEASHGFDDLGGGVYRLWATLDPSLVPSIAIGDFIAITFGCNGTAAEYFHAWGLTRQIGDTTHYDYQEDANDLRMLTLADTTIVLNPHVKLDTLADQTPTVPEVFGDFDFTGTTQLIQDVLYVQVVEGAWESDYRISIGSTIAEPTEVTVRTSDGMGSGGLPQIDQIHIEYAPPSGTWSVSVQGVTCSYTVPYNTVGSNANNYVASGLVKAINKAAGVTAVAKKKYGSGIIIEGPPNTSIVTTLGSKPAAGAWSLAAIQNFGTTGELDSVKVADIAQEFVDSFNALPASFTDYIHCGRIGESTLFFYSSAPINYYDVSDSKSDTLMRGIYHEVRAFDQLPVRAHPGARFKITLEDQGETEEDIGYFVEYEPDTSTLYDGVDGQYVESTDYAVPYKLDARTFPHKIVPRFYDKDGNLYDGTAASGTPGALYFEFSRIDWEDRLVGDETLSPWPQGLTPAQNPAGSYQDLFYARGRLGFVAGGVVDFSEASRYFSFFRTTNRTLLDGDPFSVAATHPDMDIIHTAVPFAERLVLVSDRAQMLLSGEPLSARTVHIEPFVRIDADTTTLPLAHKRSMFFLVPKANYLGLTEIYPENQEIMDADRSLQVPQYIPQDIRQFSSDRRGEFFILRTESQMFLYAQLKEGGQLLQSAWSEITFDGGDEMLFSGFNDTSLICVVLRDNRIHLETMSFEFDQVIASAGHQIYGDRLTTATFGAYDSGAGTSDFTLPWKIPTGATVLAFRDDGTELTVTEQVAGGTNIVVSGDQTGQTVYFGVDYNSDYEFTIPFAREFSGRAQEPILSAGVHLLYNRVALRDTMAVDAIISTTGSTPTTESYSASTPTTEEWEFSILAPAEETSVILRASGGLPCNLLRSEWDANLKNRGSRPRI